MILFLISYLSAMVPMLIIGLLKAWPWRLFLLVPIWPVVGYWAIRDVIGKPTPVADRYINWAIR